MHPQLDPSTLRRDNWLVAGWSLFISGVTLWPFWEGIGTSRGSNTAYALRDMMVPTNVALNDLNTGVVDAAPRNLPQDTLLAVLSPTLSAVFVCSLIVAAAGCAGGFYAARMIRDMAGGSVPVQMAATLFVMWNPFTIERFLQGQWSIAVAGMLMPALAYTIAARRWGSWPIFFTAAAIVPTGAVLATIVSLVFAQRARDRWITLGFGAIMYAPWVIPTLFNGINTSTLSSPASAELFAARAEEGVGTLGALMSLGGIWNSDAVPPSLGLVSSFAGLILSIILLTRFKELWQTYRGVAIMTVAAIVLPVLLSTGWGLSVMGWIIGHVPGTGLLRDTQKFVCLAIPGYILLFGSLANHHKETAKKYHWPLAPKIVASITSIGFIALTILLVPAYPKDMAPLRTQNISVAWQQMSDALHSAPVGRTLLLPPGSYQQRGDYPALSPALKVLPGQPLDPGYLIVDGQLVDGNRKIMSLLESTMAGDLKLAENGVSWVLIDTRQPGSLKMNNQVSKAIEALEKSKYPLVVNMDGYRLYRVTEQPAADALKLNTPRGVYKLLSLTGMVLYWMAFAVGVGLWVSTRIRHVVRRSEVSNFSQALPVADQEKD